MTTPARATVHDSSIAARAAFVYGIITTIHGRPILYIGQTMGHLGALGRLAQHLSESTSGTLRQRLMSLFRTATLELGTLELAAVELPRCKTFWSENADYREAVESLVQNEILNALFARRLPLCLVSRVQPNSYCRLKYVRAEADRVLSLLLPWLDTHGRSFMTAAAGGV
jgi:hypothetical protein